MPQEDNLSLKRGMTKMTNKQVFRGGLAVLAGIVLSTVSFSLAVAQQSKLRVIQTNSAGDNVHIIDPVSNKVVGEIKGIEAPHGVAVAPDGSRIYISEQADKMLVVVDGKTLQVTKRIPLSGNPNLIDLTPDGRWIYVAIAQSWTDLSEFPQIKAATSGGVDVIDTKTNEIAWKLVMNPAPSPMAISKNPDGSTKWIFAQLGGFNGFSVVDFAAQAKINEIKLPEII